VYRVLGIDNEVDLRYCEIYLQLKNLGELISGTDLLIATTAMKYDHTLVTKDRDSSI
jgi:predicted nucleic acid-binding protein